MKTAQDKYWDNVTKGHKKMFSAKVRARLYEASIVNALLTLPTLAYLVDQKVIGMFWLGLVSVVNAGVFALARKNVTPDEL